jgi:hypothetical protein
MIYATIIASLITLIIQSQASAWHRGLMSIAKNKYPFADASTRQQIRDELSFITPRFVSSRSGISGILILVSAVLAGLWIGTWWGGLIWLVGLGITANLLSRLLLPGPDAPYWGVRVMQHADERMRGAILASDFPLAHRYEGVILEIRDDLGLDHDDVFGNAMSDIKKQFADRGIRPSAEQ